MIAALTAAGLLLAAPVAQAHELTCSKSRFGHRVSVERHKELKVDDVAGHVCVDTGRNRIRYIACRGRFCVRQDVFMYYERAVGPLWWEAMFSIGPVRWGNHG